MAKQGHFEEHWNDADGNPAGGVSSGRGFAISWQNGPLGQHTQLCETAPDGGILRDLCSTRCTRRPPNGAFVEDVLQAIIGRIEFYQASQFYSPYNASALASLQDAARALDVRTKDRERRAVEGTHAV